MRNTFFRQLITSGSKCSSKRFAGLIGWFVCLIITLYCTFANIQAPQITEYLFICSTSLLGISVVTNAFSRHPIIPDSSNKNNDNKDKI